MIPALSSLEKSSRKIDRDESAVYVITRCGRSYSDGVPWEMAIVQLSR